MILLPKNSWDLQFSEEEIKARQHRIWGSVKLQKLDVVAYVFVKLLLNYDGDSNRVFEVCERTKE